MEIIAPASYSDEFLVCNDGVYFQGTTSSYIDRQVYLYGGYEQRAISLFQSVIPASKRNVILDIGANVGTHSLQFARMFSHVHAFEPNERVWRAFEQNVSINGFSNVTLHKLGMGNVSENLAFYAIDKENHGLGTFVAAEQYDLPLERRGVFRVERGDDYLNSRNIDQVDAIKVDVQGFEPEVLSGLQQTLKDHKPVVWFEYGKGTQGKLPLTDEILQLFPYDIQLHSIETIAEGFYYSMRLKQHSKSELIPSDYVAVPKGAY